jgi:hypothetical protein
VLIEEKGNVVRNMESLELCALLVGTQGEVDTMESTKNFLKKGKLTVTIALAIPLLGVCPGDTKTYPQMKSCAPMFLEWSS